MSIGVRARAARTLERILQRKSVAQIQAETRRGELKRSLGALNLVLLGIGIIIGTGIFVLTGRAAAQYTGPGIVISFVITGALCAFVALCYAELASALPVSGSAYSYAYASLGEGAAWIMGLLLFLEYGLAAATVSVGWSGYAVSLLADFGIRVPAALTAAPAVVVANAAGAAIGVGVVNLPAIVIVALATRLLMLGVTESARANNIIVFIKLTVVIAFIAVGARYVNTAHWSPLIPPQTPPPPPGAPTDLGGQIGQALLNVVTGQSHSRYGIEGLIHGAAVIFFAYLGFDAVSTAGAEAKNPSRDMPIGILGALVICTALYIATSAVLVGIVPYTTLDNPAPIAMAVNAVGLPWFAVLVKAGALAGLSSVILVSMYGQTRVFYSMSRDGLTPGVLARVHPRLRTPLLNTLIVGAVAAGCGGFLSLDVLSDVTNVGSLVAFALVCITVIYLRWRDPGLARPFRAPLFPFTPALGALMCLVLLMSLMAVPATRRFFLLYIGFFLLYIGVGIIVYFVYGIRHSRLGRGLAAAPDLSG